VGPRITVWGNTRSYPILRRLDGLEEKLRRGSTARDGRRE
jgi:hypothetical protein